MSEPKWTPAQRAAIADRGGALLVSAAAGSGKTAVLTERAVRLITDPDHPVDADRLLIVTFTNAAAAELRARIGQALLRPPSAPLMRSASICSTSISRRWTSRRTFPPPTPAVWKPCGQRPSRRRWSTPTPTRISAPLPTCTARAARTGRRGRRSCTSMISSVPCRTMTKSWTNF